MPVVLDPRYFVRCGRCSRKLRTDPPPEGNAPLETVFFPTPTAALAFALELDWTFEDHDTYCPNCQELIHQPPKET